MVEMECSQFEMSSDQYCPISGADECKKTQFNAVWASNATTLLLEFGKNKKISIFLPLPFLPEPGKMYSSARASLGFHK